MARGGWRTVRDAAGKQPIDVARERGHHHLVDELTRDRCTN
ncbi:hypothetical protein [Rhodococcus sp. HNM0569]|nr:hypothetical protein [Rhodococcus sp. HNM0569]